MDGGQPRESASNVQENVVRTTLAQGLISKIAPIRTVIEVAEPERGSDTDAIAVFRAARSTLRKTVIVPLLVDLDGPHTGHGRHDWGTG
jgi:hypothetical protein